jgi:hypothetical protein
MVRGWSIIFQKIENRQKVINEFLSISQEELKKDFFAIIIHLLTTKKLTLKEDWYIYEIGQFIEKYKTIPSFDSTIILTESQIGYGILQTSSGIADQRKIKNITRHFILSKLMFIADTLEISYTVSVG